MNSLFEIATKISTPLGLCGLIATILFYITGQFLDKIAPQRLTERMGGAIIQNIINKLFYLALISMVLGFLGYIVTQYNQLRITHLELLDESSYIKESEGHSGFISKLAPRSNNDFSYRLPADLHIAFLFQCTGYSARSDLGIGLETTILVMDSSGKIIAEASTSRLNNVREWRQRPTIVHVGIGRVTQYLGLPSVDSASTPIPFLIILHDFNQREIPDGDAIVRIQVHDTFTNKTTNDELRIHVKQQ